jgi:long-chain acyl-CoA synthetase
MRLDISLFHDESDQLNNDLFRDGYFFTGDPGRRDEDGQLYLLGRKKFFINKGGYKINPQEIEDLLESHVKVEKAVVIGLRTPYGDDKVKAVIVLKERCTEEEIIEYCRDKIASFKIPSLIEFTDNLPKSAMGKVRRAALT